MTNEDKLLKLVTYIANDMYELSHEKVHYCYREYKRLARDLIDEIYEKEESTGDRIIDDNF